jgi:signal transduction histidine kinase
LVALIAAALPPLIGFSAFNTYAGEWLATNDLGSGTELLVAAGITVVWVGLVAAVAGRFVFGETQSLLELAERGRSQDAAEPDGGMTATQRRLANALEERNRQIAQLAARVRAAPIAQDATAVARAMVGAARSLTGDDTWELAVLRSGETAELAPGVYRPDGPMEPLGEVHAWASTLDPAGSDRRTRHAVGPWGAFVVVDVDAGEDLRAVLLAPWEGRPAPSPAELDLLDLLAQHAATAIEHAVLYGRLRVQADELNRMAQVQTDFLRGVTHDLQTPLTSIRALASELGASESVDSAARADLDSIAYQADRLRRMVAQLLAVSRLEAGALTPITEVFRAEPVARRAWEALRADRPFELVAEGPEHLLVADPDRVEQVLWALYDNAVKYSPAGSPIRVVVSAGSQDGALLGRISVRDEGVGMEGSALDQAFDQFYRSDDARRLSPDGSGVGLYAARGLVRAMGGEIRADSRLGHGTEITISLPAETAES